MCTLLIRSTACDAHNGRKPDTPHPPPQPQPSRENPWDPTGLEQPHRYRERAQQERAIINLFMKWNQWMQTSASVDRIFRKPRKKNFGFWDTPRRILKFNNVSKITATANFRVNSFEAWRLYQDRVTWFPDSGSIKCWKFIYQDIDYHCFESQVVHDKAVRWTRRLVAGFSRQRPEYVHMAFYVRCVVDKVALGHVRVLRFARQYYSTVAHHTHIIWWMDNRPAGGRMVHIIEINEQ
jgi:hypothetical protein